MTMFIVSLLSGGDLHTFRYGGVTTHNPPQDLLLGRTISHTNELYDSLNEISAFVFVCHLQV